MGSPRVGAMVSSLAMVDSSLAMDSSKAPIILLRAMDSRTSTRVAVEVAEGVGSRGNCLRDQLPMSSGSSGSGYRNQDQSGGGGSATGETSRTMGDEVIAIAAVTTAAKWL